MSVHICDMLVYMRESDIKMAIERHGGTLLYINWKKNKVHMLKPNGTKVIETLYETKYKARHPVE